MQYLHVSCNRQHVYINYPLFGGVPRSALNFNYLKLFIKNAQPSNGKKKIHRLLIIARALGTT